MAMFEMPRPYVSRLVVTGAAGQIGTFLAGRLDHLADIIVRSDLDDVQVAGNEVSHPADLTDLASLRALLRGGGDVLHFGGQSVEAHFERICEANLIGTYNLYEAARLEGVRRILFASSNHAIGFHSRRTRLDAESPVRPDSLYGVSKVYGEALASLYFDKFGIETLNLRIGSCLPEPGDRRHMATWLSIDDMVRLIERMVGAPEVGFATVYGASDNDESWWDNAKTAFLGWNPQDNSEAFREKVEARETVPNPQGPYIRYQGGVFTAQDHPGTTKPSG